MYHVRRATIAGVVIVAVILITSLVPKALNPTPPSPEDERRDKAWVATSPYWVDRQVCRWFSACGLHHMRWDDPVQPRGPPVQHYGEIELKKRDGRRSPEELWENLEKRTGESRDSSTKPPTTNTDVPDYVLKNAPLVHLYSDEHFWPSDIAEHVQHMKPWVDKQPVNDTEPLTLNNLGKLNALSGMVYLTSQDDVEQRPEWLSSPSGTPAPFVGDENEEDDLDISTSDENSTYDFEGTTWWSVDREHPPQRISDPRGREEMQSKLRRRALLSNDHPQKPFPPQPSTVTSGGHKPDANGYSAAPAILVLVDKGSGILDAFWFFFYSYNLGQTVLTMRFGNHVGDWEHCMIRFEHGVPRAMFLSEHEGGQAYAWSALEKKRVNVTLNAVDGEATVTEEVDRPVIYSAVGSHAMYAFPGPHAYVLPFHMLKDDTDRGPLWDPSLNNLAYFYDYTEAPPPPEEDEGSEADEVHAEESSAYPFNTSILEYPDHAKNSTVTKRGDQIVEPISLVPASSNPNAATSWFHFAGPWGDELYSLGDFRQWRLFGQYHYVTGPMGPKFKRLGRQTVCQSTKCRILHSIEEGKKGSWHD